MTRARAIAGSAVFFLLAPGLVAGVMPWAIAGWEVQRSRPPLQMIGAVLLAAGAGVLVHAFARFVTEGSGTPAPVAPPERLVVGGLYRYVRNPMYVAVVVAIIGQGLILGAPAVLAYGAAVWAATAAFVRFYEEPTLQADYGEQYDRYRRHVRAWIPRRRPWEDAGEPR